MKSIDKKKRSYEEWKITETDTDTDTDHEEWKVIKTDTDTDYEEGAES